MDYTEKLKKLREESGLSRRQMSELLGISRTFYWQLENKKRRISYRTAFEIAHIFGIKPDDIFYDDFKGKLN